MTDDQRPEFEWPSEDLAQGGTKPAPQRDAEWPSEDLSGESGGASQPPAEPQQPPPAIPAPDVPPPVASVPVPPPPAADSPPAATDPPPGVEPAAIPQPAVPEIPPTPAETPQSRIPEIPPTPPGEYVPPAEYQQLPPPTAGPPPAPAPFSGPPPIAAPVEQGPYALMAGPDTPNADGPDGPESDEKRKYYRPDIEGLRAIAVLAVLLFHIGLPLTTGGFVGVDVFYVISGFLITGLLLREGHESGRIDLLRFYARRMRRLLPAALVVIVVTLLASAVIVTPLRLTEIAGDAAAAALYVANFRFALDATNYLAMEAPSPLLHYWSLAVEEQFYLVWPLILLVATRIFSLRFVGLFILVLALASFALSYYWTDTSPAWAFFSPFTRAWELAAGALIAVGLLRIPARAPRFAASVAVVVGLTLIIVSVVLLSDETPFPGVAALVPVVGTVLVILGGVRGPTIPGRVLLANSLSRYLGRISYSLYLWHWPILILLPIALGNDELIVRIGLAWLAVLMAIISTELIEQPFRRSTGLAIRSRGSIQLGLSASVAVGVVALMMSGAITVPVSWIQPDPVAVELAGVRQDLPRQYADGCNLTYEDAKLRKDCVYGDAEGTRTAMLIGDSHAAQWLPALDGYARQKGWRLEAHTKSACSVAPVPVWERKFRRVYDECLEWRADVLKRVRNTQPAAVFVGNSRDYELWDNGRVIQSGEAMTYWQEQLTELLRTLDKRAGRVVLLAETPFLNYDPIDCLADDDISNCDPPAGIVIDGDYAALETAAAADAGVTVLSANELLCPGTTCPVVADDIVVFRDAHHVTASFMEHLAEPIGNLLEGRAPYPSPSPSPSPAPVVSADPEGAAN